MRNWLAVTALVGVMATAMPNAVANPLWADADVPFRVTGSTLVASGYPDAVVRGTALRVEFAARRARLAAVKKAAYSSNERRAYVVASDRALEAAEDERAAREELEELRTSSVSVRSKARPIVERAEVVRARYIKAAALFVRHVPGLGVDERAAIDALAALPRAKWRSGVTDVLGVDHPGVGSALGYVEARAAWDDARAARDAAVERSTDRASMVKNAEKALERATGRRESAETSLHRLVMRMAPHTRVDRLGCPLVTVPGVVPEGVNLARLCSQAVAQAATPQAKRAVAWALAHLGAPYACDGATRMAPYRFDCSSFVSRAYAEGAGTRLLVDRWAPTTHTMQPWGGAARNPAFRPIRPQSLAPGDLVLYRTCVGPDCLTQHVVMYLGVHHGRALMAHTNLCGGVSRVSIFWGTGPAHAYMGSRRVAVSTPTNAGADPD